MNKFPKMLIATDTNERWHKRWEDNHGYFAEYLDNYTIKRFRRGQSCTITSFEDIKLKGFRLPTKIERLLYE